MVTLEADDGTHTVEQTWNMRVSQGIVMGTGLSWQGHTGTTGEYEACYDANKAVSPQTLVFTVFQLERLKGVGGGTTGWSNGATWEVVDELETAGKADAIGFTAYPYFEYADPSLIPADYFDEIALHWSGPVIFTEIGWKASATFPYPGDETDQADFVDVFFEGTRDLDLEYVAQLFLHDWDGQASLPPFVDIGLRSNDGSVIRASDAVWRAAVSLREL